MNVVEEVYKITADFPKEERFGLLSQIRRCAVSVPSNIAEGAGRVSKNEFKHFLSISLGSSYELETQLELSLRLNYITKEKLDSISQKLDLVQKMIHGLHNSIT